MQRRRGAAKKGKDTEEEQQGRQEAKMEAPKGSTIIQNPAQRVAINRTTASKMEVELEKMSAGKTAEIKKGLKLWTKTDEEKTAPVEMRPQIEGGAHISMEQTEIHSLQGRGLKPQSQNQNRTEFPSRHPTPGSKSREPTRGRQKDQGGR